MKLTYKCPICDKPLTLVGEVKIGKTKLNRYKCGHIFAKSLIGINKSQLDFTSVDNSGKTARPYQEDGVQFILESDFNVILADQMRLGKTPQACLALKNAYKERTPALILVRSANVWQWIREYKIFTDPLMNGIFPIVGTEAWIPPGFKSYICSMDTFGRNAPCKCGHKYHEEKCKGNGKSCTCRVYESNGNSIRDKLKKLGIKLVIVDEAHSFKNPQSNRSQALVEFISFLNTGEENLQIPFECTSCAHKWTEEGKQTFDKRIGHTVVSKSSRCPQCMRYCYVQQQQAEKSQKPEDRACGLILLTGTPIKNRAEEYFVLLNLVAPDKFSSLERFRHQWLEQNYKGAWSKVKTGLMTSFQNEIAPYVLRREKEDVFKELPLLNRNFTIIEPEKEAVGKRYNEILDKLEVKVAARVDPSFWQFKDDLMELRQLCGLMKVMWVADMLETEIDESEGLASKERYAIGLHHESVRDVLFHKLGGESNCLKLDGKSTPDSESKDRIMRAFETSKQRILLIGMLAGGVGMDFHYVNNVTILERQWSSADEEQFEFRFYNPDLKIKSASTDINYVIAKGTIDEFFFDMVEAKRRIFGETISKHWSLTEDNTSFKQLLDRTLGSRI